VIPRAGRCWLVRTLALLACVTLLPSLAWAQASLAGVARDTSSAVLPGVTVEAASAVLIEKVRTAVTDGRGQYRIPELPPGSYTITFTLPGFSTVQREAVQVSGVGVITINADMRVGGLEETITVTGETPIVDVRSARRGQTLTDDVIKSLPATRGYNALIMLVPSIADGDNQIDLMPAMRIFNSHGGRGNEGRVQVDGLNVGAAFNGGGVSGYVMDPANAQEVTMTVSGGSKCAIGPWLRPERSRSRRTSCAKASAISSRTTASWMSRACDRCRTRRTTPTPAISISSATTIARR
jgi:hypothetical protein